MGASTVLRPSNCTQKLTNCAVTQPRDQFHRRQWSRDSWGRVSSCVLAIFLAWWPVAAFIYIAVLCRYIRGPELAGGYIIMLGVPSWLIALAVAVGRGSGAGGSPRKGTVFALCCLPLPLIVFRVHVLVAKLL